MRDYISKTEVLDMLETFALKNIIHKREAEADEDILISTFIKNGLPTANFRQYNALEDVKKEIVRLHDWAFDREEVIKILDHKMSELYEVKE